MNILIAADYATPASGNFIASCVELGRVLKKQGHTLSFVFPENANTLSEKSWVHWLRTEGFSVSLAPRNLSDDQILDFLKPLIASLEIDILHIHFGMFHHAVVTHAGELGVKLLVHDHMDFAAGSNLHKQKLLCLAQSLRYRMKGIAVASVNPQKDRAYALAKHRYIPNGLSLIRNTQETLTVQQIREEMGLLPEERICLFLGWDLHRKGLDIAVKAIRELRKEDSSILLGVVGVGTPPGPGCVEFVSKTTGEDPHSEWLRYLPSREDMFAYHRGVDVYLSASRSEAFSYGILEAISQNTPVVVSDIKGTSWCHGYSKAVVYPTEDPLACANAIRKALTMGKSESNADAIVEAYSINKWCDQMLHMYLEI